MKFTLLSADGRETVGLFEISDTPTPDKPPTAVIWQDRVFSLQVSSPRHCVFREVSALVLRDEWRVDA